MVATRGKKKHESSNKNIEENETAEKVLAETWNSDSPTVDVVEPNEDAQLEDKVDLITDKARNENSGEMSGEEIEEDSEDPNMPETETNGDNKAESEENTFEDDEIDDQEDMPWEDEEEHFEHDNEERVLDEFEVSEEEATEEDDEVSGEEATEEDEVSEEEATKKENYEDNNQEEKGNAKKDTRKAKAKEDGREAKEHSTEKPEANLQNINKSNERKRKKKVQAGRLKKVDSEDKPESSRKRKVKKRVDSMGMIFMCSSETKKDCYQYRVLGLPESKKDIVEKIYTGMRLFLYDVDLKLMYGIYKAAGPGGYNIEPKAFKSQFPSQVRFKVLENCLPLAEEKFKIVIKENYFTKTKFDCQLNSEQVKKLCRLFAHSRKGHPSKKLSMGLKAEKHKHPIRQERNRRQRTGDKRHLPLREEVKQHERPRKRPRKVMNPAPPPRQRLPAPLPLTVPSSYVYGRASDADVYRRDLYLEPHSPYRDRHDRPLIHLERYKDGRDPHLERHYAYRGGRDSHVDRRDPLVDDVESYSRRRDPYRDERVPYLEPRDSYTDRRDSYRDGRDPYTERRDSYRDGRVPYIERRDSNRDGRDPYIDRRDSYRDGRASYTDRRVSFGDIAHSERYNTYRRDSLLDNRDVSREDRGVELRDSYRRDELLGHRDLHPIDLATRNHHDIDGRDAYVSNRERPSYAEPVYRAAYPSRAGVYRL